MLDFKVYTFLAVYEYMNYTRAVEVLHITRPAVSQHIQYLENMHQVKLFLAEGRRTHLSPAGERLFHAATTLKNDEVFLRKQMLEGGGRGLSLRFGTTRTIGESVISAPLAHYIHSHPGDHISVVINNTDELVHKLVSGEIQLVLVRGYYDDVDSDSMVFRTEPFIPVCVAGHVLAREPIRLRDLLRKHLLTREPGSGTRDILEKSLDIKNIRLSDFAHITEIGSMYVILQLLEEDAGITPLYRIAVEAGIKEGMFRELELRDSQMEHDLAFIWNKRSIYADTYRMICRELQ